VIDNKVDMSFKKRTAFLICPLGERGSPTWTRSERLLSEIVEPTLARFGFITDHFVEPDIATNEGARRRLINSLESADICIADLTGNRPNVFFEYGFRRGVKRPVMAFVAPGQQLPFDVDDYYTQPYDLQSPTEAIAALETFLEQSGFPPPLQLATERQHQVNTICDFIKHNKPKRINVIQLTCFGMAQPLFEAIRFCPNTTVCLLLMHPVVVSKYALRRGHGAEVLEVENLIKKVERYSEIDGSRQPTIGLWFYRHEPSVAAVMADNAFLALGWYSRDFSQGNPKLLRITGHDTPGILVQGAQAARLMPRFRDHFNAVWRDSEMAGDDYLLGPAKGELLREWELLKGHGPVELDRKTATS
jgi:nucleoside 2-deoxyribosyltransferase